MSEPQSTNCTQSLEIWQHKAAQASSIMNWVAMFHYGGVTTTVMFVIIKLFNNKEKCRSFTVVIILLQLYFNITMALKTYISLI